ncbi:hypothetical protein GDO86_000092, partial [Hymenochirus boettgeri]
FVFVFQAYGQVLITQSPDYVSVTPGESVTITCKGSGGVASLSTYYMAWYQQKPGQAAKLLIYNARKQHTGTPKRFVGSGAGSDFTFVISRVEVEDAAHYHCQHYYT